MIHMGPAVGFMTLLLHRSRGQLSRKLLDEMDLRIGPDRVSAGFESRSIVELDRLEDRVLEDS
jgi:hypothetical protein